MTDDQQFRSVPEQPWSCMSVPATSLMSLAALIRFAERAATPLLLLAYDEYDRDRHSAVELSRLACLLADLATFDSDDPRRSLDILPNLLFAAGSVLIRHDLVDDGQLAFQG